MANEVSPTAKSFAYKVIQTAVTSKVNANCGLCF
jgi:hypothetical protein